MRSWANDIGRAAARDARASGGRSSSRPRECRSSTARAIRATVGLSTTAPRSSCTPKAAWTPAAMTAALSESPPSSKKSSSRPTRSTSRARDQIAARTASASLVSPVDEPPFGAGEEGGAIRASWSRSTLPRGVIGKLSTKTNVVGSSRSGSLARSASRRLAAVRLAPGRVVR